MRRALLVLLAFGLVGAECNQADNELVFVGSDCPQRGHDLEWRQSPDPEEPGLAFEHPWVPNRACVLAPPEAAKRYLYHRCHGDDGPWRGPAYERVSEDTKCWGGVVE